jgi:hypothetical protein
MDGRLMQFVSFQQALRDTHYDRDAERGGGLKIAEAAGWLTVVL